MANDTLNTLLKDYEHKKFLAEMDLEKRKSSLYSSFPELKKMEDDLNSFAIETTKSILLSNSTSYLKKLNMKIKNLKNERKKFLKSKGYDISYLSPNYECSICSDTGFIEDNGKKVMCSCLKQRLLDISYDNSNLSNLKNDNFSNFNANIFSNEVDLERYGQNISPRKNILNIKNRALDFVKNFDDASTKNLLFSGNTGSR